MTIERLNMVVGIATAGRREILSRAVDLLASQSRPPDRLLISRMASSDVDEASLERFPASTLVLDGAAGLTAQRNKILSAANDADIVVFFDDDFFACDTYLSNLERLFLAHPKIVAATGCVLADGATGPGLSAEEGLRILGSRSTGESDGDKFFECYGTYGCNMAFRAEPIRLNKILFDENLPFYGWQEDIDFSRQLVRHGLIVTANSLQGVHLGTKLGRTSGVRFGYSQIANPVYLIRKGTLSWKRAANLMWRNIAANLVRSLSPEPWVDRRGRLKGNMLAAIDLVLGRSSPRRILQLS
jgi:succinoglycan biosynthesis transport protein ExoP